LFDKGFALFSEVNSNHSVLSNESLMWGAFEDVATTT